MAKILIDGKEYISSDEIGLHYMETARVREIVKQFIIELGFGAEVNPEPAPVEVKKKGFFRR